MLDWQDLTLNPHRKSISPAMSTRRQLALTLLAAIVPPVHAQVDGRGGRFEDDLFSHLEGEWLLTRVIGGRELKNAVSASYVLQHQFLLLRMRDVATPSKYEADIYIGYSNASKEYVAHWIDNFGAHFSAVGRGRREGNSVEFRFQYPDGPFFNTFSWEPETQTWHCHLQSAASDGTRSTFAKDTLVRKA